MSVPQLQIVNENSRLEHFQVKQRRRKNEVHKRTNKKGGEFIDWARQKPEACRLRDSGGARCGQNVEV
jgi:hypothetical protein